MQNPVVLRLSVKDDTVTAAYRAPDAAEWTELGSCPKLRETPRVGLFTHGGQRSAERRVRYDDFQITAAE